MHAVFFFSETIRVDGVEDHTIYLFDDEESAYEFVFDVFVKTGDITVNGDVFICGDSSHNSKKEVVEAAQEMLSSSEFVHAYDVVDKRITQAGGLAMKR